MIRPDQRMRAAVVVPARDEAARIARCLLALAGQRDVAIADFEVIVVLDECRDATGAVVAEVAAARPELRLRTIELPTSRGVGRARGLGMEMACRRLLGLGREDGLIASTDADSTVAPDWLSRQLALVREGALAIGGQIELNPLEARLLASSVLRERERRSRERMRTVLREDIDRTVSEHHQFSGASLALTAGTYRSCGGLPAEESLEDEALERALRERGVPIHRSSLVRVRTSARTDGRAPRGLAQDLARWSRQRMSAA